MSFIETISADDNPFAEKTAGTASSRLRTGPLTTAPPDGVGVHTQTRLYVVPAVEIVTYDCEYCGHCETPNECAWSRVCVICNAAPRTHCKTPTGGVTALHLERWEL